MANTPHKRPQSRSQRIWKTLLYVALVAVCFSMYQLYAHYKAEGAKAVAEGRRLVISLPDGAIEPRVKEEVAEDKPEDEKIEEPVAEEEKAPEEHGSVEEKSDEKEAASEDKNKESEVAENKEPNATSTEDPKADAEEKAVEEKPPTEQKPGEEKAHAGKDKSVNPDAKSDGKHVAHDKKSSEQEVKTDGTPAVESGDKAADNNPKTDKKSEATPAAVKQENAAIKGPKIAIIISGLGLSKATTEEAITLPANITLGFSSYASNLQDWVQRSKALGYSILLELPMETADYPITDPGPLALLSKSSGGKNIDQLYTVLSQAQGFEGLIAAQNENFTFSRNLFEPVLGKIKDERLFFVYQQRPGNYHVADLSNILKADTLPYTVVLDEEITEEAINKKLTELESIANQKGSAIAVGRPYPLTVNAVKAWAEEASKRGITIVPAKTLVKP